MPLAVVVFDRLSGRVGHDFGLRGRVLHGHVEGLRVRATRSIRQDGPDDFSVDVSQPVMAA